MPTPEKAVVIDELTEIMGRAKLAVLTDYRGLTVSELQALRASLRKDNAEFRIAKNTLTRIAAERTGVQGLNPLLEGPLALMFAFDDIVGPAKTISDFVKSSKVLTVKGAVLDGQVISASDVEELASMPSREVLLGKLLGLMVSPMSRTVGVLSGPSRSAAYVLQARVDQLGGAQAAD